MKTVILTFAIFAALTMNGQTVNQDQNGNFFASPKATQTHDSTTTKTFTDSKGNIEPVYQGAKGSFYLAKISKNGKYYRKYLKVEAKD